MTTDETKATEPITLEYALNLAFRAGESRMLASYKDFVQIHEPASVVVPALASRVLRLGATHTPLPVPVIDILPGLKGAELHASIDAAVRDGGAGVITVDGRRCYVQD